MKIFLYTIPVAFLVAYSQLIVKWRIISGVQHVYINSTYDKYLSYFLDPYILSAYFIALLASFIWFIVIQRIPLSIGFPIYIGSVFFNGYAWELDTSWRGNNINENFCLDTNFRWDYFG